MASTLQIDGNAAVQWTVMAGGVPQDGLQHGFEHIQWNG
jgi:hypothetical protein